ncbi:MAG: GNAT family N-acetyltransferase [Methanocorpusculum sp.]|nr:GNAT family N-acetyltransferase [Methanocorpusculum sp.]
MYESRTVGYMIALFTDDIAYFLHLAVAEECRGKGFGSRAIEFFNRKFASHLIFFAVETPSEDAENQWQRLARIRLYERYGYRLAGIDILDDGTPFSVMCRSTASEEDIRKNPCIYGSYG